MGSPLSFGSLREDLQIDHKTAESWLQILENLYVCFRIAPYGPPRVRAVKKAAKLYLWDWSSVEGDGPRFENMVASQLLKYCSSAAITREANCTGDMLSTSSSRRVRSLRSPR